MTVEHKNPEGTYQAECEVCGQEGTCRLRMVDDRYVWACVSKALCRKAQGRKGI